MRLCFIVEEKYRLDGMPLDVVHALREIGHDVEVLEPQSTLTAVSELSSRRGQVDAFVLKTVSDGPGLSLLSAAEASGHVAINRTAAIRQVRDKAVAAAVCRQNDIPFPLTYFASRSQLLDAIPPELYPIVVKPANGSANEDVHLVGSPSELAQIAWEAGRFLLAQPYADNPGRDLKVYCAGGEVFATVQPSPLHPHQGEVARLIDLEPQLYRLARRVGQVFGLDIYGLDVVESPNGWVVVDVNDFPSFRMVPQAADLLADMVLQLALGRSHRSRAGWRRSRLAAAVATGVAVVVP